MSLKTTLDIRKDYLLIRASGVFLSGDEVEQYAHFLLGSVETEDVNRVLLNEQQLIDKTDPLDASYIGNSEKMVKLTMRGVRIACLFNPKYADQARAYETALQNRSISYRNFISEDEALDWLLS